MMALVHELEPKLSHIPPAWEGISRAAQLTISQFMSGAHEEDGTEAMKPLGSCGKRMERRYE